jgi:hypothetical protein
MQILQRLPGKFSFVVVGFAKLLRLIAGGELDITVAGAPVTIVGSAGSRYIVRLVEKSTRNFRGQWV